MGIGQLVYKQSIMNLPWLQSIQNNLFTRLQGQQLHHGILLDAAKGCGEEYLLVSVAKALVCESKSACGQCKSCSLFVAHSHPDIKWVKSDKPSIGVDQIREVGDFVVSTSQLLGNKVVIIPDIQRLTESASNSLLKTLEEPNSNTYLLLSTTELQYVLPTIKSRCEKIRLSLPQAEQSLEWLHQKTDKTVNRQGLDAYSGSPLLYLAAITNNEEQLSHFSNDLQNLLNCTLSPQSMAAKWINELSTIFTWTYQWAKNEYQNELQFSNNQKTLNNLEKILNECIRCKGLSNKAGINKSLLLCQLFNKLQNRNTE